MADMRRVGGLFAALAWLTFPAVPVVLESAYHSFPFSMPGDLRWVPDPHDWTWEEWVIQLGPLVGFAYLAGATLDLPDPPTLRRGPRGWLGRRSFWVAVGPWAGFLGWMALIAAARACEPYWPGAIAGWLDRVLGRWGRLVPEAVKTWVGSAFFLITFSYAWLLPAFAAVRRARRLGPGRVWRSVRRGVEAAVAYVGSLIGSFWAITEAWRSYYFDARIVPAALAALSLAALSGCSVTITYGELRRRELFHAMLLAWVFGLALFWLWWSRPRTKPPRSGGGA
jgi:hypothetical protein